MSSFEQLILDLSTYSGVPAIILGLLFKIQKDKVLRYAFLYVLASFLGDFLVLISYQHTSYAYYLGYIWTILHPISVGMFFIAAMGYKSKYAFLILLGFTILMLALDSFGTNTSITANVTNILCLGFALKYFHYLYQSEQELFIEKNITFWIACTFFFVHAGKIFSTLLAGQIATTIESYDDWLLHNILNLLSNLFIGFAFLVEGKKKANT